MHNLVDEIDGIGGSRCAIWCKQAVNREGGCNSNCKQVED